MHKLLLELSVLRLQSGESTLNRHGRSQSSTLVQRTPRLSLLFPWRRGSSAKDWISPSAEPSDLSQNRPWLFPAQARSVIGQFPGVSAPMPPVRDRWRATGESRPVARNRTRLGSDGELFRQKSLPGSREEPCNTDNGSEFPGNWMPTLCRMQSQCRNGWLLTYAVHDHATPTCTKPGTSRSARA